MTHDEIALSPELRLRLAKIAIPRMRGRTLMSIDTPWHTLSIAPSERGTVSKLLAALDGRRSLAQVARDQRLHLERVVGHATQLYRAGVAQLAHAVPVDARLFHDHTLASMRLRHVQQTDAIGLIERILATRSKRLLLGYLVESYHLVHAAASHMAGAVLSTSEPGHRMKFSRYLSEEHAHGEWLAGGLKQAGVSSSRLLQSAPLFSTLAVINFLRWTALSDPLVYGLCIGLSEAPSEGSGVRHGIVDFWRRIDALKLVPSKALVPFRDHQLEDLDAAHDALSIIPFEGRAMSTKEQSRIAGLGLAYADTLAAMERGVLQEYGS